MDNFNFKKFLAEGKLKEETEALDRESVVDMAQMVADEFTKEDASGDKFSTYMTYKVGKVDGLEFELDTEATKQTPAEEIKYGAGEGMGGIFRINVLPNGYEIRNVEKGGLVATMDMEDGFKMLSADESRDELDMKDDERYPGMYIDDEEWEREMGRMEENKEETKSNKMKKSELKEMIKSAFLNEKETFDQAFDRIDSEDEVYPGEKPMKEAGPSDFDANKPARIEAFLKALDALVDEYHAELYLNDEFFSAIDDVKLAAKAEMGGPVGDIPGFEGTKDALDSLSIREEEEEVEADTEDIEVDTDVEMDTEVPAEPTSPKMDGDAKEVQDNLEAALAAAKAMGDQKLVDQIGNSITFFTRTHVVGKEETAMEEIETVDEDTVTVNEIEFPMWTKIKK